MYEKLSYLHGRAKLAKIATSSLSADAAAFLEDCDDYQFLDFIELIFKWQHLWDFNMNPHELLKNVNEFLEVDDLPYYLTEFVFQSSTQIETYPQIIRRDNEAIHETAIQPGLTLLVHPAFASANKEFLEALGHYRKGEHADCLAKCGSSFESVMKIICDRKKWPYKQTDTAETLLNIILGKTGMESFFNQPIMLVATMRNRLSSAHGAGTQQRNVPEHRAQFAVNATASAILLLVHETNP